jgi:hypothetical protein
MKIWNYIISALLLCGLSLSAHATVTATVSKNEIAEGETIQLRIQRDGSADSQPDISPLKRDFDVLGSSSGSNVQIISGQISRQTQIMVLLSPKHDGKILIPPLPWGNEQSEAIVLTVGGKGGAAKNGNAQADNDSSHVFITTSQDQSKPYVQAAVVLTVRLFTDQSLLQASMDLPASSDVLVKPLGKVVQSNETRNGHRYQIIERKYLLFPQRSGKLSLNGPVLDAQVPDTNSNDPFDNVFRQMPLGGMLNAVRPIRVHAKVIELNVLPRPANVSGANWLPAQNVILEEQKDIWKQNTTIHVGELLTRHLKITAMGLTGAQLPDPNSLLSVPEGIKAYPDQATIGDDLQSNSVLGSREQSIALIANRPGHYELPAVQLSWWDTLKNVQREIRLPAHTLDVLPATTELNTMTMPTTEPSVLQKQLSQENPDSTASRMNQNQAWMWTSLVLGLLWLGTTVAWWRASKRALPIKTVNREPKIQPDGNKSEREFKALKRACSDNDATSARQHLLAWAHTAWPDSTPRGLNELSRQFSDVKLIKLLRDLDRACYTGSAWQGADLLQSIQYLSVKEVVHKEQSKLPSLYD